MRQAGFADACERKLLSCAISNLPLTCLRVERQKAQYNHSPMSAQLLFFAAIVRLFRTRFYCDHDAGFRTHRCARSCSCSSTGKGPASLAARLAST